MKSHRVVSAGCRFAWAVPIAALLVGAVPASAQSVVWNAIDVQSRLDNDGRLHVVETHRLELREGGDFNWARDFGLSVDQAIAFGGVTRVGPGTEEVALVDAEGGTPDRYRYYPRGHVYIAIPRFENGTEITYRLEYELLNALQPAWALGAGNGPLVRPPALESPWPRVRQAVGELREAWSDRHRLYRLDHDVLFPSRDGPGFVVRRIDYQIRYDTAWKLVDPSAELAQVQADQDYRVRRVFERVDGGTTPAVDGRSPWIRWAALAALFVAPPLLWLLLQAAELVGSRLAGPVTFEAMSERLAKLAPESVKALVSGGWADTPQIEDVLGRMAGERKIAIEIDAAGDPVSRPASRSEEDEAEEHDEEEDDPDLVPARPLRLRRLVPLENLPDLERELLQHFLVEGRREVTTQELQKLHAEHGLAPWSLLEGLLPHPNAKTRSLLAGLLWLVALAGVALQVVQVSSVSSMDLVPIVLLANLGALFMLALWPRGYWHGSQGLIPALALLVPGFLIAGAAAAYLLSVNPPLAPQAFVGAALTAAAGYGAVLARSRRPWRGEPHATVRELGRIRGYAWRELGRARPRLDDRFVAHLEALGLGPRLEAWRRSAGSGAEGTTVDGEDGPPLTRPFTGRPTVPFAGPPGWSNALAVESADERREAEED